MGFLCNRSQQDEKAVQAFHLQTELKQGEITDLGLVLLILSLRFGGDYKYIFEGYAIEAVDKNVYLKGLFIRGTGYEYLSIPGCILAFQSLCIELSLAQLVDNAAWDSGAA